jgi:uncharacterized protein DUF1501
MDRMRNPFKSRREVLQSMGAGLGVLGLWGTLDQSRLRAAAAPSSAGPLDPKPPHFPARAKHVILLCLNGGLSHVDSFDPKPMLDKHNGQPMPGGNPATERKTGNLMRSPFRFKNYGHSGIPVSELFPLTGECADDLCVIRSMYTDVPNHEPSLFMLNCGTIQPGRPSLGSWLLYGLGTDNQNLPGFVVLCPGVPVVGPPLWNSAFLPAVYQGTHIRNNESDPDKLIQFVHNSRVSAAAQREQLDALSQLNRIHAGRRDDDPQLEAGIQAMEVAFRMQTEAPRVFDLSQESRSTLDLYGAGDFARGCLMARRLVEHGVRMVQVYFGSSNPWDSHEDIMEHQKMAVHADRPIAALIKDLKTRGLLHDTLVIVGTEFGRTPTIESNAGLRVQNGRDHNSYGYSTLLAGAGIKGGIAYGATDDFGSRAAVNPVHPHDLQATVLQLLGIDHTRLTFRYSGRDFRLTDVEGRVIKDILV